MLFFIALIATSNLEPVPQLETIEHTPLQNSTNAIRTFCVTIPIVSEASLLQPTVLYTFHNRSARLLLHQDAEKSHKFCANVTFEAPEGWVTYMITAGNAFWSPPNKTVASFYQRFPAPTAAVALKTAANNTEANHTIDPNGHHHYHDTTSGFYAFLVVFCLFIVFAGAMTYM